MAKTQVTAKDTREALKHHVLPLLRDYGFTDGTPTRLWRHNGDRIDIVELTHFSKYRAMTDKTTTASFEVRIGICLPGYSALLDPFQRDHIKQGPHGPRPSEPQMPIRGMICPADSPPMRKQWWGWEVQSTWYVESDEDAVDRATDLASQFQSYALDWLNRDWQYPDLLVLLQQDETSPVLINSENGSYLRLQAEVKGSQVRAAHIAMVRKAISRKTAD